MNAEQRRKEILSILAVNGNPVSATALADTLNVSRQIIVGDIAILRASGADIVATPRGYIQQRAAKGIICRIACRHDAEGMRAELYAIVDNGCKVIDVIVDHPIYGQLSGMLQLATRADVDQFMVKCASSRPLSYLTDGVHLHTLACPNDEAAERIRKELMAMGILLLNS